MSHGNRAKTSKTGRRASGSRTRFISDTMSKKELKEYTKAGKVETYNMYETIIPKYEFDYKNKETQKAMLTRWREIYDNKKIMNEMGISSGTLYSLINEFEIPQKQKGGYRGKRKSVTQQLKYIPPTTPAQEEEHGIQSIQQSITNGLNLEYSGKYDSEQLSKIFTKLQLLIEGEENGFNVSIRISEE